jgi:hypothetical protein
VLSKLRPFYTLQDPKGIKVLFNFFWPEGWRTPTVSKGIFIGLTARLIDNQERHSSLLLSTTNFSLPAS